MRAIVREYASAARVHPWLMAAVPALFGGAVVALVVALNGGADPLRQGAGLAGAAWVVVGASYRLLARS